MLGSLSSLITTILPQIIWVIFIFGFIILLLAVLPSGATYPLPTEFATALQTMVEWMNSLNYILPIDTLLNCFFYITVFDYVVKPLWKVGVWIFGYFTGAGR